MKTTNFSTAPCAEVRKEEDFEKIKREIKKSNINPAKVLAVFQDHGLINGKYKTVVILKALHECQTLQNILEGNLTKTKIEVE